MARNPSITGWAHTNFGKRPDPDVEALSDRVATATLELLVIEEGQAHV